MNKKWPYAFFFIGIVFFGFWIRFIIKNPVSYDIGEGFLLDRAMALASGDPLYPSLISPPFLVTPYTPGVIIMLSGLVYLFGGSLWPGRLFTLSCFLGTVFTAAHMIKDRCGGWKRSLLFMSLLLCSYHVISMATIYSIQWPAIFLSLLGLAFFKKMPYFGFFIMSLGVMAKQSQLMAPAAGLIWMLLKDWRRGFRLGVFFLACLFLELWVLFQTGGEPSLNHILLYAVGTYDLNNFLRLVAYCLAPYLIYLIIGGVFAFEQIRSKKSDLILIYLLCTSFGLLASFRIGADVKYFLEFYLALFMVASISIHQKEKWIRTAAMIQMILLALFTTYLLHWNSKRVYERHMAVTELIPVLKKTPGCLVSEDSFLVVRSGKKIFFESFPMSQLSKRGIWDQSRFIKSLSGGEVSAVVLQFALNEENPFYTAMDRFTPQMKEALKNHFYLERKVGPFYLYFWRKMQG